MEIIRLLTMVPIFVGSIIAASVPQYPFPSEKLDKNKEYVCVQWTGTADYSQKQPTICLKWEVKEKPFHRRV